MVRVVRRRPYWFSQDHVGEMGRVTLIAGPLYRVRFALFDHAFFYMDEIEYVVVSS